MNKSDTILVFIRLNSMQSLLVSFFMQFLLIRLYFRRWRAKQEENVKRKKYFSLVQFKKLSFFS